MQKEDKVIICLAGQKRAGKDTVANVLKSEGFTQLALADSLRDLSARAFEIPLDTFINDNTKEKLFDTPVYLKPDHLAVIEQIVEKEWGFEITPEAHNKLLEHLETPFKHPRNLLQYVGTDILRQCIDDDIFLKLASNRVDNVVGDVVISDCRFKNEREFFKSKGATLVLVKRASLKQSTDGHISENDLGEDKDYDVIIHNDSDISQLNLNVSMWINMTFRRRK